jgi:hypothetical protein
MATHPTSRRRPVRAISCWTDLPSGGVLAVDRRLTPGVALDLELILGGDRPRWLWITGTGELLKIVTPIQA